MMTFVALIKFVRSDLVYSDGKERDVWTVNPYDLFMLNSLVSLKQRCNCRVIGVTMGTASCMESLKKLLAIGLDDVYLISDYDFVGSDTYATSYIISEVIKKKINVDIITCGEKSIDGETGQVGIELAKRLGLHCLSGIEDIVDVKGDSIILKRTCMENSETIRSGIPLVITYKGFSTIMPQISLLKLKQAKRRQVEIINSEMLSLDKDSCGQRGSKTKVLKICEDKKTNSVFLVEGRPDEKVIFLHNLLLKEKKIEV